jgi:hypothetical protein
MLESLIVAVTGGIVGVAITFAAIRGLQWLQPAQLPRLDAVAVDLPVLMFAAAVAIATALLAGSGPAVLVTNADAASVSKGTTRAVAGTIAGGARASLVIAEIAASIVLLVGAGLLARTLGELIETDLGVNFCRVAHDDRMSENTIQPPTRASVRTPTRLMRATALALRGKSWLISAGALPEPTWNTEPTHTRFARRGNTRRDGEFRARPDGGDAGAFGRATTRLRP